jgi:molybdopterin-guanine dinucleotide biosynthesis protein
LIGGTGRNVGKTTLVCDIISHFSQKQDIVGLKITNHFHAGLYDTFFLHEEKKTDGTKDSSRMLNAGATKVFYIESEAGNLETAFLEFSKKVKPRQLIVCESNGLSELVNPGVYLMVDRVGNQENKSSALKAMSKVDAVVEMKNGGFQHVLKRLSLGEKYWQWNDLI